MTDLNYLDVVKKQDLTIAHLWTHFAGMTLPPGCTEHQRKEMRHAFYAGFIECFKVINDVSIRLSEKEASQLLSRINAEGNDYYRKWTAQQQRP